MERSGSNSYHLAACQVTIQKVREVSQKLRESLENYRRTLERPLVSLGPLIKTYQLGMISNSPLWFIPSIPPHYQSLETSIDFIAGASPPTLPNSPKNFWKKTLLELRKSINYIYIIILMSTLD